MVKCKNSKSLNDASIRGRRVRVRKARKSKSHSSVGNLSLPNQRAASELFLEAFIPTSLYLTILDHIMLGAHKAEDYSAQLASSMIRPPAVLTAACVGRIANSLNTGHDMIQALLSQPAPHPPKLSRGGFSQRLNTLHRFVCDILCCYKHRTYEMENRFSNLWETTKYQRNNLAMLLDAGERVETSEANHNIPRSSYSRGDCSDSEAGIYISQQRIILQQQRPRRRLRPRRTDSTTQSDSDDTSSASVYILSAELQIEASTSEPSVTISPETATSQSSTDTSLPLQIDESQQSESTADTQEWSFSPTRTAPVSDDLLITVVQLDGESPLWRAEDDLMFLDVDDEESYHHEEVVDSKSDTNTSESPLNLEARTSHAIPNIQTDTNDTSANLRAGFGDEILPAEERICQLVPSDTTSTLSAGLITPSATTSACPGTDAATLRDRTLDMLGFTPNTSAPVKSGVQIHHSQKSTRRSRQLALGDGKIKTQTRSERKQHPRKSSMRRPSCVHLTQPCSYNATGFTAKTSPPAYDTNAKVRKVCPSIPTLIEREAAGDFKLNMTTRDNATSVQNPQRRHLPRTSPAVKSNVQIGSSKKASKQASKRNLQRTLGQSKTEASTRNDRKPRSKITSYTSDKVTDTDSAVRKVYSSIDAFHYEKAALEAKGDIDTSRVTSVQDLIPSHLLDCMPGTSAAAIRREKDILKNKAQARYAKQLKNNIQIRPRCKMHLVSRYNRHTGFSTKTRAQSVTAGFAKSVLKPSTCDVTPSGDADPAKTNITICDDHSGSEKSVSPICRVTRIISLANPSAAAATTSDVIDDDDSTGDDRNTGIAETSVTTSPSVCLSNSSITDSSDSQNKAAAGGGKMKTRRRSVRKKPTSFSTKTRAQPLTAYDSKSVLNVSTYDVIPSGDANHAKTTSEKSVSPLCRVETVMSLAYPSAADATIIDVTPITIDVIDDDSTGDDRNTGIAETSVTTSPRDCLSNSSITDSSDSQNEAAKKTGGGKIKTKRWRARNKPTSFSSKKRVQSLTAGATKSVLDIITYDVTPPCHPVITISDDHSGSEKTFSPICKVTSIISLSNQSAAAATIIYDDHCDSEKSVSPFCRVEKVMSLAYPSAAAAATTSGVTPITIDVIDDDSTGDDRNTGIAEISVTTSPSDCLSNSSITDSSNSQNEAAAGGKIRTQRRRARKATRPPGVQVISTTIEMETLNVFATPQCSSDDYKRLSLWLGGNGVIRHDRLIVSIPLPSSDTKRTQFINYFSPEKPWCKSSYNPRRQRLLLTHRLIETDIKSAIRQAAAARVPVVFGPHRCLNVIPCEGQEYSSSSTDVPDQSDGGTPQHTTARVSFSRPGLY